MINNDLQRFSDKKAGKAKGPCRNLQSPELTMIFFWLNARSIKR